MLQTTLGGLTILTGIVAAVLGVTTARTRLQAASRTHQKTAVRASLDEWQAWFVGGFSGMAVSRRAGSACAIGLGWIVAGVTFIVWGVEIILR